MNSNKIGLFCLFVLNPLNFLCFIKYAFLLVRQRQIRPYIISFFGPYLHVEHHITKFKQSKLPARWKLPDIKVNKSPKCLPRVQLGNKNSYTFFLYFLLCFFEYYGGRDIFLPGAQKNQ